MDVRIQYSVVSDNGSDGMFFRNGERWLREHGVEHRLLDLAPHLEAWRVSRALLFDHSLEHQAVEASKEQQ